MQSMQISSPPQSPAIDTGSLLRYGFSIIPLHPFDGPKDEPDTTKRGKKPLVKWEEFQTRRATVAEVARWKKRYKGANYGIVTGEISGICVLDIDKPEEAREWITANGGLPRTPCVRTAKGEHHYFRFRDGLNNTVRKHGCDFRGEGGYVVSPGSIHTTGTVYEWITTPDESPYAELPAWIANEIRKPEAKPEKQYTTSRPVVSFGTSKYGAAALVSECDIVRSTPEGGRNDQLNRSAFNIGRLIAGGEIQRLEAEAALFDAARACGLSDSEARKTLQSGIENGMKNPRTAPEATHTPQPTNGGNKENTVSFYPFSDLGNAERFAERNAGKCLYDWTAMSWLVWTGKQWTRDNGGAVDEMAVNTVRAIVHELQHATDEQRTGILAHALKSENSQRIDAMIKRARGKVRAKTEDFDSHPMLLNLDNCTLNLDTMERGPHDPDNKLTKISPVSFDAAATCPKWIAFLNRIFQGNAETIQFVRQMAGYCLTSDTKEQAFFVLYGTGANGKSTFVNTLLHIAGSYGKTADFETFTIRDGRKWELAELVGSRIVAASEGERGKHLAEAMIKSITGGEEISVERKNHDPFNFRPEFKVMLSTNHKPKITGTDHAIWRRVHLVPFDVKITDDERDPDLLSKLRSEASGILNWMLQGLESWKEKGLLKAEAVQAATATYRGEQDSLAPFIDECCVTGAVYAELSTLYELYDQWATRSGEHATAKRIFSQRLTERGFTNGKGKGNVTIFRGIGVKSESNLSNP